MYIFLKRLVEIRGVFVCKINQMGMQGELNGILGQLDQWSDHLPHKQQVAGSSPTLSTKGMAIWNLIINRVNGKENVRQY